MSIEVIFAVVKEEFRMFWSEWSHFRFALRRRRRKDWYVRSRMQRAGKYHEIQFDTS